MRLIVPHLNIGDVLYQNPSLAALAVSEFYSVAYAFYNENCKKQNRNLCIYHMTAVFKAELWSILEDANAAGIIPPQGCTCTDNDAICQGCVNTETLTNDLYQIMNALAVNFEYNSDIIEQFGGQNLSFEVLDPSNILVGYGRNNTINRYGDCILATPPPPVINPFTRYVTSNLGG